MEVVIIFLRFIKQTRPTSILHFFFILRIPFYSSYSFLYSSYFYLFFVLFFYSLYSFFIMFSKH